jgi:hypothetical protein
LAAKGNARRVLGRIRKYLIHVNYRRTPGFRAGAACFFARSNPRRNRMTARGGRIGRIGRIFTHEMRMMETRGGTDRNQLL